MRSMCGGVLDRALVFGFLVGFDVCMRILLCYLFVLLDLLIGFGDK